MGTAVNGRSADREALAAGAAAYTLWGLITIYWHAVHGVGEATIIAWRITASALLLVGIVAARRRWAPLAQLRDRATLVRTVLAALALTTNWSVYIWCVTHGRVVDAALGYLLSPIGMVLTGALVLHEHLGTLPRLALALAALSVAVLSLGYGEPPVLAVVIAASWTLYGLLKKRVGFDPLLGLTAETLVLLPVALAVLAALALRTPGPLASASTTSEVLLLFAGVVTTVPLLLFAHAARRVRLTTLGWLQYIVPTINLVLGVAVYGESMPAWRVVGFAVAWLALLLVSLDGLRGARAAGLAEPAPVPLEG